MIDYGYDEFSRSGFLRHTYSDVRAAQAHIQLARRYLFEAANLCIRSGRQDLADQIDEINVAIQDLITKMDSALAAE